MYPRRSLAPVYEFVITAAFRVSLYQTRKATFLKSNMNQDGSLPGDGGDMEITEKER